MKDQKKGLEDWELTGQPPIAEGGILFNREGEKGERGII